MSTQPCPTACSQECLLQVDACTNERLQNWHDYGVEHIYNVLRDQEEILGEI